MVIDFRHWPPERVLAAGSAGATWLAVALFDPARMEGPDSPVDGLVAPFLAGVVFAVLVSVATLFWRVVPQATPVTFVPSVLVGAGIAWCFTAASLTRTLEREVDALLSAFSLLQTAALLVLAVSLAIAFVRYGSSGVRPN